MIVVTNVGANVNEDAAQKYGVELCSQSVLVAGKAVDTWPRVSFDVADGWVRTSPEHPHVLGTTAKEFVSVLQRIAQADREIIVVQGSRKLIQSFQSATSAAKSLNEHPRFRDVKIHVVDSGAMDAAVGLIVVLAASAAAEGVRFEKVVTLVERAVHELCFVGLVRTFDYLVRGGRASVFKARLAELLRIRPLIGLADGEIVPIGRFSEKSDPTEKMVDHLEESLGDRR